MCFKEAITPHPTIHFLSKEKFCGIYGKDTFWLWNDVYIELLSCLKKYESFTRQTVTECIKNLTCRGLIVWADFSVACLNNETANIAQTRTNNTFKVKVHSFVQMARCSENVNLCWRICQLVTKRHFSMNDVTRLRQFWNITSSIYAKYHSNHAIISVYYYPQKVCNFTCRYFKLSWNTTAL